ncbi:hypothetical protein [Herbiconiux sp. UC225_62]|uniref:hypothetical protein n=1 Tax=Herbiconiux sp. UC225_62 TaxID=3350168 RepID=UPI0036D31E8B
MSAQTPAPTRREAFGRWVFGPELAAPRRLGLFAAVVAAMLVAGILITFYRLPSDQRNLIWAEDGTVFLTDAFRNGYLSNLFTPYAGYMHFVPRTAAQLVAAVVPLRDLGIAMNLIGAAVWSTVAIAAFVFTRGRLQTPLRWLLWLLVLLLPIGSMEVATNVANSHWFLIFGVFLALSARSGGVVRTVFASVIVLAAVLSDPLALLFAPLVVARLVGLRTVRENIVSIVFVAAAVIQIVVDLGTHRDREQPEFDPIGLGRVYALRVIWGTLMGPKDGSVVFYTIGDLPVLIVAALVLAALVTLIVLRRHRAGFATLALIGSLGFFGVLGVLTWGALGMEPFGVVIYWAGRYLVVASLLLITAIVAVLSIWIPEAGTARRPALRVVALVIAGALLIAPGISNYRTPAYKAGGTQTSSGLQTAEDRCELRHTATAPVPIAPREFSMILPCRLLLEP